jgi:dTDP-4-dehydrorhamnose reductase
VKKKILLIGSDSRLSRVFYARYNKIFDIYGTSRKRTSKKIFFLDLKKINNFNLSLNFQYVIFVSGITDYDSCEKNYLIAKKVNCINIPKLALKFLKKGSHIIFISSNVVFKYKKKLPNEKNKTNPGFGYAKLKNMTEKKILSYKKYINKISIVRFTKNIDTRSQLFSEWIKNIKAKKNFTALKDLYFSPILYQNSADLLYKIISKNLAGIYHLSGEKDISYYNFAKKFLSFVGLKRNLVRGYDSNDLNIKLTYNHPVTGLSMQHTTFCTGLKPITLREIFIYLYKYI